MQYLQTFINLKQKILIMKGFFVHAERSEKDLALTLARGRIGPKEMRPLGSQLPRFKDVPLICCSYFCQGYEWSYREKGVIFKPKSEPAYVIPADAFELMRSGRYLPGHERFVFSSVEEMLEKYPSSIDFQKDFREYFKKLNPEEVFYSLSKDQAECHHDTDYSQFGDFHEAYNEVAFQVPLEIEVLGEFHSRAELKELAENEAVMEPWTWFSRLVSWKRVLKQRY
jgi:hypothetical protein